MFYKLFSNARIYLFVAAILSLAALITVAVYTYRGAKAVEERALIEQAETIALSLDPREIAFLSGSQSDLRNPFYISLKKRFENIQRVNSDIRFVYLAGKDARGVFFYLDSEPQESPDYSPPGQSYNEASRVFKEVFDVRLSRFEGPMVDRWGSWVSAFTPMTHPDTGETVAILGIDVDAWQYQKNILFAMSTPALSVILLFSLIIFAFIYYKKEGEILALKTEFLSIAAHDLRSPLTGLSWMLQGFSRDQSIMQIPGINNSILLMERTCKSLLDTTKDILDTMRLENGSGSGLQMSEFRLSDTVRETIDALTLFAREKSVTISLLHESNGKEGLCRGDKAKIKRVVLNILSNAIKYSPVGGAVKMVFGDRDDCCSVSIANSGPNIPENDQKNIFSKFFRARDKETLLKPGNGLGLYYAKQFIEAHGGKIWFESNKGAETTFYIQIPNKYD